MAYIYYFTVFHNITTAHEGHVVFCGFRQLVYFGHLSYHIPVMLPYMQIMKPDTLAS